MKLILVASLPLAAAVVGLAAVPASLAHMNPEAAQFANEGT